MLEPNVSKLASDHPLLSLLPPLQSGVCWMYSIILMELVLLVFLLYIGISNQ
jgi:hypothetical protein